MDEVHLGYSTCLNGFVNHSVSDVTIETMCDHQCNWNKHPTEKPWKSRGMPKWGLENFKDILIGSSVYAYCVSFFHLCEDFVMLKEPHSFNQAGQVCLIFQEHYGI